MKTRFFRIAVEGATSDGRTILREWIEQMAAGYNPDTYTARINCEHIKGFSPDAPFNAYGSVVALKAEEITLQLDGKPAKRLALFAQLDANDNLVATVKAGQKIFTSAEVAPDFAQTGKAGLVGLAVTDNPASLGCEALSFSAFKPMFDRRKTNPANLFTAAEAAEIAFEAEPAESGTAIEKLTAAIHQVVALFKAKPEPVNAPAPGIDAGALDGLTNVLGQFTAALTETDARAKAQGADVESLRKEFSALKAQLADTEAPRTFRAPATGGNGTELTDC